MIGDLSMTAPSSGTEAGAGPGRTPPVRAGARAAPGHGVEPRQQPPATATSEQLEAQRLKALLTDPSKRVSMHRDGASGHVVMRVEHRTTGEVIDQIPSEDILRLYASMRESLVDERA